MRKEFVKERNGKSFVLYAGLLDLAHERGLKSIVTTLVQIPCEENHRVAICTATAVMGDGVVFTGIGDAAPNNVAPAMQTCLIRMAETRAKARALRDAVNIGTAAMEELGPEGAAEEQSYSSDAPVHAPVRDYAAEFKARAESMGYEGKMSPLCGEIVKKDKIVAADYAAALLCSGETWNNAVNLRMGKLP